MTAPLHYENNAVDEAGQAMPVATPPTGTAYGHNIPARSETRLDKMLCHTGYSNDEIFILEQIGDSAV